jgi:hypothetical protein
VEYAQTGILVKSALRLIAVGIANGNRGYSMLRKRLSEYANGWREFQKKEYHQKVGLKVRNIFPVNQPRSFPANRERALQTSKSSGVISGEPERIINSSTSLSVSISMITQNPEAEDRAISPINTPPHVPVKENPGNTSPNGPPPQFSASTEWLPLSHSRAVSPGLDDVEAEPSSVPPKLATLNMNSSLETEQSIASRSPPTDIVQQPRLYFNRYRILPLGLPSGRLSKGSLKTTSIARLGARFYLCRQRGRNTSWRSLWSITYISTEIINGMQCKVYFAWFDGQLIEGLKLLKIARDTQVPPSNKGCSYGCTREGTNQWATSQMYIPSRHVSKKLISRQLVGHLRGTKRIGKCVKFPSVLECSNAEEFLKERTLSEYDGGLVLYFRSTDEGTGYLTSMFAVASMIYKLGLKLKVPEMCEWTALDK